MPEKELLERLKETHAILDGHFLLSSGLHSDRYIQCAKLLQHPFHAAWCGEKLAEKLPEGDFDVVVSPAIGGIVIGQEVARVLGVRNIFVEKEDGVPTLRRGFFINPGEIAVVVEDVITTGKSTGEVIKVILDSGGQVGAACAIVDRGGSANIEVPFTALTALEIQIWDPAECPMCADAVPIDKPGSRTKPGK